MKKAIHFLTIATLALATTPAMAKSKNSRKERKGKKENRPLFNKPVIPPIILEELPRGDSSRFEDTQLISDAIFLENIEALERLFETGLAPNGKRMLVSSGRVGSMSMAFTPFTPLTFAIHLGKLKSAQFFLDKGGDINTVINEHGVEHVQTPLIVACKSNNPAAVDFVLKHKPDINLQVTAGKTALHMVTERKNTNLVKKLVDAGADFTIPDENGNSAKDIAKSLYMGPIVHYFSQKEAELEQYSTEAYGEVDYEVE